MACSFAAQPSASQASLGPPATSRLLWPCKLSCLDVCTLSVRRYVVAPADVSAASVNYHHEARAITMTLGCKDGRDYCATLHQMGELARLANLAGFDWVTLRDTVDQYVNTSGTTTIGCPTPLATASLARLLRASCSACLPCKLGDPPTQLPAV